jgi:hypothetical protein
MNNKPGVSFNRWWLVAFALSGALWALLLCGMARLIGAM